MKEEALNIQKTTKTKSLTEGYVKRRTAYQENIVCQDRQTMSHQNPPGGGGSGAPESPGNCERQ